MARRLVPLAADRKESATKAFQQSEYSTKMSDGSYRAGIGPKRAAAVFLLGDMVPDERQIGAYRNVGSPLGAYVMVVTLSGRHHIPTGREAS